MKKLIVSLTLAAATLAGAGGSAWAAGPAPSNPPAASSSIQTYLDLIARPTLPVDKIDVTLDCVSTPGPFASKAEFKNIVIQGGGLKPSTQFC